MNRAALFASALLLLSQPVCAGKPAPPKAPADAKKAEPAKVEIPKGEMARAEMKNAEGKKVGDVTIEQTPQGVIVSVSLENVPAGMHAFHIHETGKCEAPFKSAGGHFNPGTHKHGIKSAEGKHAGDMPNVDVPEGGKIKFTFFNGDVTLKEGEKNSLLDADGSAFVLHKGADDYASDPTGGAGDRWACGVIEKDGAKK